MYPTTNEDSVVEAYCCCKKILERVADSKASNFHNIRNPIANKMKRNLMSFGSDRYVLSAHYLRHIRRFIRSAIDGGVLNDLDH